MSISYSKTVSLKSPFFYVVFFLRVIFDACVDVKILRWEVPVAPDESRLRETLVREGYSVFKWADSSGTCYESHEHSCHESVWILEGEVEFEMNGQSYVLRSGDRLFLPAGVRHAMKVVGAESCFYLVGQKE